MQEIEPRELARRLERLFGYLRRHGSERVVRYAVWSVGNPLIEVIENNPNPTEAIAVLEQKALELQSQLAWLAHLPTTRFCKECGKPFTIGTDRRLRNKVFCSKRCKRNYLARRYYHERIKKVRRQG